MPYTYRSDGAPIEGDTNGVPFNLTKFTTGTSDSLIRGLFGVNANTDVVRH
jgi:hypothetical protein